MLKLYKKYIPGRRLPVYVVKTERDGRVICSETFKSKRSAVSWMNGTHPDFMPSHPQFN